MKKLIFDIVFDVLVFIVCVFMYKSGLHGTVIAIIGLRVLLLSILSTIQAAIDKLEKE